MSSPAAFIATIIERPDEDAPRLVYADWLDERGDCDRAEFIRVQCELAKLPAPLRCLVDPSVRVDRYAKYCKRCRCRACRLKRREYYVSRRRIGIPQPEGWCPAAGVNVDHWRRGFVEQLRCRWEDWLRVADAVHWHPDLKRPCPPTAQPLRRVELTTPVPPDDIELVGNRPLRVRLKGRRAEWPEPGDLENGQGHTLTLLQREWPGVEFVLPPAEFGPSPLRLLAGDLMAPVQADAGRVEAVLRGGEWALARDAAGLPAGTVLRRRDDGRFKPAAR